MISEDDRYELRQRLDEVLGPKGASTLMSHLPPVGWADVATKQDLRILELSMHKELTDAMRRQLQWLVTTQLAFAAVVIAAVRI
jgi:hypothetical protein